MRRTALVSTPTHGTKSNTYNSVEKVTKMNKFVRLDSNKNGNEVFTSGRKISFSEPPVTHQYTYDEDTMAKPEPQIEMYNKKNKTMTSNSRMSNAH